MEGRRALVPRGRGGPRRENLTAAWACFAAGEGEKGRDAGWRRRRVDPGAARGSTGGRGGARRASRRTVRGVDLPRVVGDNEFCVGEATTVRDANSYMHLAFWLVLLESVSRPMRDEYSTS